MMGAVFAMQGFGQLGGAIVMLCLVAGFKSKLEPAASYGNCVGSCQVAVDKMWRALIGIGIVPACIALYYRLTIPETPRYTFDVARDVEKANEDTKHYLSGKKGEGSPDEITQVAARRQSVAQLEVPTASFGDFFRFYGKLRNGKILFGTAMSWLLLDVAFYGLGLNSSTVLQAIGYAGGSNLYQRLYNLAAGNCILICAGAIPGYWLAVATIDTVGRKPLQLIGFTLLTILFIIWGFAYDKLSSHGMLAIYVLIQLFFNWGPNTTTFIVPGECFPTRYRSTSHGISAGSGKIGSIIVSFMKRGTVPKIETNTNCRLKVLFPLYALVAIPQPRIPARGSTMLCRSSLLSCSLVSSRHCSSLKRSVALLKTLPTIGTWVERASLVRSMRRSMPTVAAMRERSRFRN